MSTFTDERWLQAVSANLETYRKKIDGAVAQLSDTELFTRPQSDINSVATILRHLGGNLLSRWTDFFHTDGEKPDRDRDREFMEWEGDRESLLAYFNSGWVRLEDALKQINQSNISTPMLIRGEEHSVAEALMRALTHISYHVGQIVLIARMVHRGEWHWLTIQPGDSAEFNKRTWGKAASMSAGEPAHSTSPLHDNVRERKD